MWSYFSSLFIAHFALLNVEATHTISLPHGFTKAVMSAENSSTGQLPAGSLPDTASSPSPLQVGELSFLHNLITP